MAEGIYIKVSTEKLVEGSDLVKSSLTDMKSRFSSIADAVNRSNSYWKGEAADKHRRIHGEMQETIDEIMARLGEHVRDLREMAQVYEETEKEAEELAYDLPSNIIM